MLAAAEIEDEDEDDIAPSFTPATPVSLERRRSSFVSALPASLPPTSPEIIIAEPQEQAQQQADDGDAPPPALETRRSSAMTRI